MTLPPLTLMMVALLATHLHLALAATQVDMLALDEDSILGMIQALKARVHSLETTAAVAGPQSRVPLSSATADNDSTLGGADNVCDVALEQACSRNSSSGGDGSRAQCERCCGRHQHTLRAAGCSPGDCAAHCNGSRPVIQLCRDECVVTDFGAVGDGQADDRDALQGAIDAARSQNKTLRFPAGTYRITKYLDWGLWEGISVKGQLPGSAGIGKPTGVTKIFADNVEGTAHDFTASSYGIVQGIAFYGSATGAMVLNGKTLPRGYGSDITYRDCNFGGGKRGSFVNHMGEVLTWDNCRFHGGRDAPGLLITWKAGDRNSWNITAPSGRVLQTAVSVTVFRMIGGEATGDNGPLVVLDMEGAPHGGGDFISTGAYFSTSADHVSAVQVRGIWRNVVIDGSRDEEDIKPPANPDCGFVKLANGHLSVFRIHGYGDGDEGCPVLRGNGSVASGTIVSGGSGINLTRGDMVDVDVLSGGLVRLAVNGSVKGSRWRTTQRDGNMIDVRSVCVLALSLRVLSSLI